VPFIKLSCVWLKCFITVLHKGNCLGFPENTQFALLPSTSEVPVFVTLLLLVVGYKVAAFNIIPWTNVHRRFAQIGQLIWNPKLWDSQTHRCLFIIL